MGNYTSRLDRIEAAFAPKDGVHVLVVLDGETNEQALARYAEQRRITVADVRGPVVYLSELEARV